MILQYHMIHDNVHPPTRSNPSDAGLDLRWSPADSAVTALRIEPGESKLIPTDRDWETLSNHVVL